MTTPSTTRAMTTSRGGTATASSSSTTATPTPLGCCRGSLPTPTTPPPTPPPNLSPRSRYKKSPRETVPMYGLEPSGHPYRSYNQEIKEDIVDCRAEQSAAADVGGITVHPARRHLSPQRRRAWRSTRRVDNRWRRCTSKLLLSATCDNVPARRLSWPLVSF